MSYIFQQENSMKLPEGKEENEQNFYYQRYPSYEAVK